MNPAPRTINRIGALLLILISCVHVKSQPASAAATTASANVLLTAEGRVEGRKADTTAWNPAQVNQVFNAKDWLRTGFKSRAGLRLSDQSVLRLRQLTTLEIQPPATEEKRTVLDLRSGAAYFYNREGPGETEFITPVASGAIRGTEFHIEIAEDGSTVLTMLDGEVVMTNEFGEVTLTSGEQGIAEPGRPPRKTAVIDAINIIQWALYYPGVLDLSELRLTSDEAQTIANSLAAYKQGELLKAVQEYPADRQPVSVAEKLYLAAVLLAVGEVDQTDSLLKSLPAKENQENWAASLTAALRGVIAAVKFQDWSRSAQPETASEWLAESYFQQSRAKLEEALSAAYKAVELSPQFGFGWARVAELEFSFGRTDAALAALEKGLALSPRNAQALALKGFLLTAQNRIAQAADLFEDAIAVDGALGNAWLGRGLCKIRQGKAWEGRQDLQTAAALEPNRAILRSYLGKAFSNERDKARAEKEIDLAQRLDPNDPTAWLYKALLNQQQNRLNEGITNLEKSKELNDNRRIFRSRLMLDQDRAVRSANLASVYRDAGLRELSVREASRAVNSDYANHSAHLFLANSYDAMRDPRQINLRYETPWMSELLLANLLAPVGAGALSQNISQQEYSKLFESDKLGLSSSTEYFSSGAWIQNASQFGAWRNSSYAFDVLYRSDPGQRSNNDLESLTWWSKFKHQITPKDTLFLETVYYDYESGDVAQYYDQGFASTTQRITEKQEPLVFAGYHHEWQPGVHTLLLAGRIQDTLTRKDPNASLRVVSKNTGTLVNDYQFPPFQPTDLDFRTELEGFSVELQQMWQTASHNTIMGGRIQNAWSDTFTHLQRPAASFPLFISGLDLPQENTTELSRFNIYGYHQWRIVEPLHITMGLSYDYLDYPKNIDIPPIIDLEDNRDLICPKVGFIWTPVPSTHFRGFYARSLSGAFFDTSIRLEPVQVAGFTQAYRSLIPESVVGLVAGSQFDTYGLLFEHQFPTATYLSAAGEVLSSEAERTWGVFDMTSPFAAVQSSTPEQLDYEEKALVFSVDQLVGKEWSIGARYRLTESELEHRWPEVPDPKLNFDEQAILHMANLYTVYNHSCGFFCQFNSVWAAQSNQSAIAHLSGDDLWQFNVYLGYRFAQRRAEVRLGLLNLTDQDYKIHPLTLYAELPRERTFTMSLKLTF